MDELTRLAMEAREGDRSALGAFIRSSQADVWHLCAYLVGAGDADDVTQETYLRAWRSLPGFRADASARTWLLSIARRACGEHRRRQRRWDWAGALVSGSTAESDLGEAVVMESLVAQLELGRRSAFVLTQMLGLSYAETAIVCDCSLGTVRSRVARARSDLVDQIDRGRRDNAVGKMRSGL